MNTVKVRLINEMDGLVVWHLAYTGIVESRSVKIRTIQ